MKKEKTEELLVKWMDEELSPDEERQISSLLDDDPGLAGELERMKQTAKEVRSAVPASVDPPYGDFFNSQLMRKVDLEIKAQRPVKKARRWWESLRWAWAPVGALALVLSFFAGHRIGRPSQPAMVEAAPKKVQSIVLPTVYFAEDSLQAEVIANSDGEVSAIVVNGLSAIRDDIDFATVTTSIELPDSYVSAEGRRFD